MRFRELETIVKREDLEILNNLDSKDLDKKKLKEIFSKEYIKCLGIPQLNRIQKKDHSEYCMIIAVRAVKQYRREDESRLNPS